jgi:hypothetical protein
MAVIGELADVISHGLSAGNDELGTRTENAIKSIFGDRYWVKSSFGQR